MKANKDIPIDIEKLIDDIFRKKDFSSYKKADWTKYDEFLKDIQKLFPFYKIDNYTDFNYNFGYFYEIYISYPDNLEQFNRTNIETETIQIKISKIISYFLIIYGIRTNNNNNMKVVFFSEPQSEKQHEEGYKLEFFLKTNGFKKLSLETSKLIIPDIETELSERGGTTINDCIF